jgi:hypothetical protein
MHHNRWNDNRSVASFNTNACMISPPMGDAAAVIAPLAKTQVPLKKQDPQPYYPL